MQIFQKAFCTAVLIFFSVSLYLFEITLFFYGNL